MTTGWTGGETLGLVSLFIGVFILYLPVNGMGKALRHAVTNAAALESMASKAGHGLRHRFGSGKTQSTGRICAGLMRELEANA